ncbi:MAG: hypothetical protein ABW088_11945 [Sedimenticola sp.]
MVFYDLTNEDCVLQGTFKQSSHAAIPVFYDDNGVIVAVTDYMIYKSVTDTDVASSVRTYADQLLTFLRFIDGYSFDESKGEAKLSWERVMDRHLTEWRTMRIEEGRDSGYIANVLYTVFQFYLWAEENKYIRRHVAIYDDDNEYPISAKRTKNNGWTWPYIPSSSGKIQPTPTNDDLEKLHVVTIEESDVVGLRDSLLLSMYERTARRFEALQVKVTDIPDWDEIEDCAAENSIITIEVTGKKGRKRDLEFLPETMELAREYIEGKRASAVKAARHRDKLYTEPEELFLGSTTGLPLNKQYMSRRISSLMKKAEVKGTGHRVRAKGLTDVVAAYDGWDEEGKPKSAEDVLLRAAEKAGHGDFKSLRPYLAFSRSEGYAAKLNSIESLRAVETQLSIRKKQLTNIEKLLPLLNAVLNSDQVEAELIKLLEDEVDWSSGEM